MRETFDQNAAPEQAIPAPGQKRRRGRPSKEVAPPSEKPESEALFDNQLDPTGIFGLLSIEQLAKILCKDPRTIQNWISRREIPFITLGNRSVFLRDSVREWLQKKEFRPHERR